MALLTTAKYTQIVTFLANKANTSLPTFGVKHIFTTPHFFASPSDFAAQVEETSTYTSNYKVRYIMFGYDTHKNDPTKGCDDDPLVKVFFTMQLYRSIQQAKTGRDNSHDLLVFDMITLRNSFLEDRVIETSDSVSIEHEALEQQGGMVKIQQCQHIVNEIGSWINFRIPVEVNNG